MRSKPDYVEFVLLLLLLFLSLPWTCADLVLNFEKLDWLKCHNKQGHHNNIHSKNNNNNNNNKNINDTINSFGSFRLTFIDDN